MINASSRAKGLALAGGLAAFALPLVSSAQTRVGNITDLGNFIINTINNIVVPLIFAIAFIVFLYGIFETFILGARNDEARAQGRSLMLWGLIGFFIMISVWGLVNVLTGTLTFKQNSAPSSSYPKATNLGS